MRSPDSFSFKDDVEITEMGRVERGTGGGARVVGLDPVGDSGFPASLLLPLILLFLALESLLPSSSSIKKS